MKFTSFSLLLSLSVLLSPVVSTAQAALPAFTGQYGAYSDPANDKKAVREAGKKARGLLKKTITTRRAVVGMLKRVKDEKTAERSAKSMERLYEAISRKPSLRERAKDNDRDTPRYGSNNTANLEAEAFREEMEKNERVFERIQADVDAHFERIEGLGVDTTKLRELAEKILSLDLSSVESAD